MGSIQKRVTKLINKYDTNNPFDIAEARGVVVRFVDLGSLFGFHTRHFRTSIIHINEAITEKQQLFTCAHELGHAVLHPDVNTAFLKSNTLYSTDRLEVEANTFAVKLLFAQGESNSITINEAIEHYGIPEQFLIKNFYP